MLDPQPSQQVTSLTPDGVPARVDNPNHCPGRRGNPLSRVLGRAAPWENPQIMVVEGQEGMECVLVVSTRLSCRRRRRRPAFVSHTADDGILMSGFLPKRRLTTNSAGIGPGPCTSPNDRHNRNHTDYPKQRSSGLSMLRRCSSMSRRNHLIGFLPSSPVWVASPCSSSITMHVRTR